MLWYTFHNLSVCIATYCTTGLYLYLPPLKAQHNISYFACLQGLVLACMTGVNLECPFNLGAMGKNTRMALCCARTYLGTVVSLSKYSIWLFLLTQNHSFTTMSRYNVRTLSLEAQSRKWIISIRCVWRTANGWSSTVAKAGIIRCHRHPSTIPLLPPPIQSCY